MKPGRLNGILSEDVSEIFIEFSFYATTYRQWLI